MQKYRPIIVIRWIFLIGCIIVIPIGWQSFTAIQFAQFQIVHWYAVAFIILGVTFFTYLWNIYAIQHLNASIAGAYIYLQPLFAALISVLFFSEAITVSKCIAAILIFTGVWLATQKTKL